MIPVATKAPPRKALLVEMDRLRTRMREAEETLEAIRNGGVDALVVSGVDGDQVFTLQGAEQVYRIFVEEMNEGAVRLTADGAILYCNRCFAGMLKHPLERLIGASIYDFVRLEDRPTLEWLLEQGPSESGRQEINFCAQDGSPTPVSLSLNSLQEASASGICMVATDLTERRQAEERLLLYQARLRSLASDLASVQEEERRRIALGLHDRIAQVLSASKMMMGTVSASDAGLAEPLEAVRRMIDQAIQEIRALTFELSPPILHELGLEPALDWLAEQFQQRHGLRVTFEDDREKKPLATSVRDLLFRAVQELLANVVKHAHAYSARVSVRREGEEIRIEVADDGAGIDVSQDDLPAGRDEGFGLFNIRERLTHVGGRLQIHSELGQGTRVVLTAPLGKTADNRPQTTDHSPLPSPSPGKKP